MFLNRWGYDKFPKERPLVFYHAGQPISPPLEMLDGLKLVLENMVSYIQKKVPSKTLKFWRLQSPRHFYGGEWNQNGSCLFNEPLKESQVWIDDGSPHFCAFLPRFYLTITILSSFHIKIIFNTLYVFQVFINLYWGSRRRFQFLALAWKKNQHVLFKVKIC